MEDQTKKQELVREVAEGEGLPPQLVELIAQSEAIIVLSVDADGVLNMQGTTKGGQFLPEQVATHAYVAAVYREHENLVRSMNGKPTDADRYRALREFSMLAKSNPERFELVNDIIRRLEEGSGLSAEADTRAAEEHDQFADIVCQALIETELVPIVPTEGQQDNGGPAIITGEQKIILPPGVKVK